MFFCFKPLFEERGVSAHASPLAEGPAQDAGGRVSVQHRHDGTPQETGKPSLIPQLVGVPPPGFVSASPSASPCSPSEL